jgi:hypothetical protein
MIARDVAVTASVLMLLATLVAPAIAAPAAIHAARVQVHPPEAEEHLAGERIAFSVELLVQGQFAGAPTFDLPALPYALLLKADNRPLLGSRRLGRQTWVTQTHEFAIYAQRGGALSVPSFEVRFASKARFDQPAIEHRVEIEGFEVDIETPPGADPGVPMLAAIDLTAVETWSAGSDVTVEVGGALTRTIHMEATAVPAMLLPTIEFLAPEGVSVYPAEPELIDRSERGMLSAQRVDAVTYVFARAGRVELPGVEIRWWDPREHQWQRREFPARVFEVAPPPATETAASVAEKSETRRATSSLGLLAAIAALIALLFLLTPALYRRWQGWRRERASREPVQFARVLRSCRRGTPAQIYDSIGQWLRRNEYSTVNLGPEDSAARELYRCLEALQDRVIGRAAPSRTSDLVRSLREFRTARRSFSARDKTALPALNPVGRRA